MRTPLSPRTVLLHRMLLARHFAEHHAAMPFRTPDGPALPVRLGEEAMTVGVTAVLGPVDAVLVPGSPATCSSPTSVLIRFPEAGGRPAVLFEPAVDGPWPVRDSTEPVDGTDVEAVLDAARQVLRAVRDDACAHTLGLLLDGRADPVERLVCRMIADHEVDRQAVRAIDADTDRRVRAALTREPGSR